jgi:hypothetical protein
MNKKFAEILFLTKRLASAIIDNKEDSALEDADFFEEKDKSYIRNQLTSKDEVKSRQHLINQIDKKKDFKNLKTKIKPRKEIRFWHYAAAAALLFFLASQFYFQFPLLWDDSSGIHEVTISPPNISIGKNKAVLVLEDGKIVDLEENKQFQNAYLKSNGEALVVRSQENTDKSAFNYLNIPRGGQFHIVLSDGTQVWLNSESLLKFPVSFKTGQDREVELIYGEAYFDVTPSEDNGGAAFKVINQNQIVEFLGTEFNIKAYPEDKTLFTTLIEGKVNVANGGNKSVLRPNEQAVFDLTTNKMSVVQVDALAESSWKRGLFSFRGKPLKEIMQVISRWYDVDIEFQNAELESIPFRGVLGKNQNIEELLATIKSLSVIEDFEISDGRILIK